MIRAFFKLVYGTAPAEFVSAYGLAESVRRLQSATLRPGSRTLPGSAAVGRISERRVSLLRTVPLAGNAWKPVFTGQFELDRGRVVLRGRFATPLFTRIFMTGWFAFVALWILLTAGIAFQRGEPRLLWFPSGGAGLFLVGVAMVRFGRWWSREDPQWLSGVIRRALNAR